MQHWVYACEGIESDVGELDIRSEAIGRDPRLRASMQNAQHRNNPQGF
jgi:hypothetical protein